MIKIETVFSTGSTLYAIIHNPNDGTIWNAIDNTWEAFNAAHWDQYAVPMTEQPPSGYFSVDYPAAISDVLTTEVVYQQSGGAPAITDAPATGIGQSQGTNIVTINNNAQAAINLQTSAGTMKTGSVISGTAFTTAFPTNLADSANDVYLGRLVIFTSGALIRQVGNIIGYVASSATVTVGGPFTAAPGVGDTFIIV